MSRRRQERFHAVEESLHYSPGRLVIVAPPEPEPEPDEDCYGCTREGVPGVLGTHRWHGTPVCERHEQMLRPLVLPAAPVPMRGVLCQRCDEQVMHDAARIRAEVAEFGRFSRLCAHCIRSRQALYYLPGGGTPWE